MKKSEEKKIIEKAIKEVNEAEEREKRLTEKNLEEREKTRGKLWKLIQGGFMRQATTEDYAEWLKGFLLRGGKITSIHYRNITESHRNNDFYVAQKSFTLPPGPHYSGPSGYDLCLIVPKGLKIEHEGCEYVDFYPHDYSETSSDVPLFEDVKKYLLSN